VVVGGDVQVEPGEDAVHMGLHRLGAEEQALADGLVGAALGHEGEHLALSLGQLLDGIARASSADQLRHHLRINHRSTGGNAAHGVDHLVHVGDAVLEQVADAAGAVLQQLHGVMWLDVLGEHQHANLGVFGTDMLGGVEAFAGVGWGHADVDDNRGRRVGTHPRE
jgi:hypothetical protein